MVKQNYHLFLFIILGLMTGCTTDKSDSQDTELAALNDLRTEIEQLVEQGTCTESSECAYVPFGSKPCGGPWSYLVYSTSIDTELLLEKVNAYYELENNYNIKWGIASDCSVPAPPIELICQDGVCVGVYQ